MPYRICVVRHFCRLRLAAGTLKSCAILPNLIPLLHEYQYFITPTVYATSECCVLRDEYTGKHVFTKFNHLLTIRHYSVYCISGKKSYIRISNRCTYTKNCFFLEYIIPLGTFFNSKKVRFGLCFTCIKYSLARKY